MSSFQCTMKSHIVSAILRLKWWRQLWDITATSHNRALSPVYRASRSRHRQKIKLTDLYSIDTKCLWKCYAYYARFTGVSGDIMHPHAALKHVGMVAGWWVDCFMLRKSPRCPHENTAVSWVIVVVVITHAGGGRAIMRRIISGICDYAQGRRSHRIIGGT